MDHEDDPAAALWNGPAGRGWVRAQPLLDELFEPVRDWLADAVTATASRRVLDVGCGTGATTLAAARRLARDGRCTGIDVSAPMIEAARERARLAGVPVDFVVADAGRYPFVPGSVELAISRFGVMFFADPVAAFANLRAAMSPGGELVAVTWRPAAENPFMTAAERAAGPLLPSLPPRRADGPGQFSLGDPATVHRTLAGAGWSAVSVEPADFDCAMPAESLDDYLLELGPVGRHLRDADDAQRARVLAAVRPAFEPWVDSTRVRFSAACWIVRARAA